MLLAVLSCQSLGNVCTGPPSRGAQRHGEPSAHDGQAKMDCFAALAMTGVDSCGAFLGCQRLQQLGLNSNLGFIVLQWRAVNQKSIFDAFAQCGDLSQLHRDMVLRQYAGN